MRLEFSIRNRSFEYEILIFSTPSHHNCNFDPSHALNLYIRSMSRTIHPPHLLHAKKMTLAQPPYLLHLKCIMCALHCALWNFFFSFSPWFCLTTNCMQRNTCTAPHTLSHICHILKKRQCIQNPVMHACQDWFNSKGELRELELLNNIWDLASPGTVCPCLSSPWCPEISWRVRKGWRYLA